MSFKSFVKSLVSSPVASGLAASAVQLAVNNAVMNKQNRFNAEQASINREFQADQAQLARDWNLQADNSKYQRTVSDMQAAGVNPALAMSGSLGTQAVSNSMASGSSASSAGFAPVDIMSSVMQLAVTKQNLDNLKAQKANINADTALKSAESKKVSQDVLESQARISVMETTKSLNDAQTLVQKATEAKLNIENSRLDDILKVDLANKIAQTNLTEANLESLDWQNAKMVSYSEAKSISNGFSGGLHVLGTGGNGGLNHADMESRNVMGYLVFDHKNHSYSFIPGSSYLQSYLSSQSVRYSGYGGSSSSSGGLGYSGGGEGGGGR